jgi:uncharacterized protein DUF2490
MRHGPPSAFRWLTAILWIIPCAAQSTGDELRPEIGFYLQQGSQIRLEFIDFFRNDPSTSGWRGDFGFYVNAALMPVFRRELRRRPDVFRDKYLTVRAGYRYQTSLSGGHSSAESRGILEFTSRYLLPGQFAISDRNRGEFRFLTGQPFSTRYRNRLRLERDIVLGWLNCTPYVYDEIYYDTRYGRWTPNQYAAGVEFPVGPHVVLEPYYLRQHGSRSTPPHLNAFGFKLNLYF